VRLGTPPVPDHPRPQPHRAANGAAAGDILMNQTATISTVRLGATDEPGQQPAIALNRGRSRHAADRRLRLAGLAAVGLALWFLVLLFSSLVVTGYSAFTQVTVRIEADLSSLAGKREQEIRDANWRAILRDAL